MSEIKKRKVALIGAGAVGTSFLYSAMNRGIAQEYGIIDLNLEGAEGNRLDLEDASATNTFAWTTKVYEYKDLKDTDVLVITAGRPQKPGETRLEMVGDNAKIMSFIAKEVKASGFSGITIIASNPVDVMTQVFQKVTGFDSSKVIGSGTSLDSARLRVELASRLEVSPNTVQAYVVGEHGDSSVSAYSSATVGGLPIAPFLKKAGVTNKDLEEIHVTVYKKAYEIINRKRATFYGIGSALANLTEAVLRDTREVHAVGAKLAGHYGHEGFYIGTPAIVGIDGIVEILEVPLNEAEKAQFDKSATTLKSTVLLAEEAIK